MPITVSRTVETRSTRRTGLRRANWSAACGSSSKTMNSMIVGSAAGTFVQRPENLRNDCDPLHREREDQRAEIRERQAAEAADDRGRERGDDQERQRSAGRHVGRVGREQDAGERGQRAAERPREAREHRRAGAAEAASSRLSTTARIATPRRVRNSRMPQADRERDRDARSVMSRCHVSSTSPMWKPLPVEERRQRVAVVLVPDHVRETDEREHQPDRHHELHDERLALQVAHDRPVEPDAEQRRDHEHRRAAARSAAARRGRRSAPSRRTRGTCRSRPGRS